MLKCLILNKCLIFKGVDIKLESNILVEKVAEILKGKKAENIEIMDVANLTLLTDYFVICTGTSAIHIKALADELVLKLKELSVIIDHLEGYESARWILMDYGNVIIHIFQKEERNFYDLERLWSDTMKIRNQ